MHISDIKHKASEVLKYQKPVLIKAFIFIGVISTLLTYIRNQLTGSTIGSLIGLVIVIISMPLVQGYVTVSLKAVNNRNDEIDIQRDGLSGINRFKELFGTYFVHRFFLFMIIFLWLLIAFAITKSMLSTAAMDEISHFITRDFMSLINNHLSYQTEREILNSMSVIFIFLAILFVIVIMFLSHFALTFYIVEKYKIKGVEAMKESMKLMKGYKKTYILLCLSYLGWMLLVALIEMALRIIIPIPLLVSIAGVVIGNILYNAHMNISFAVLYEEIDLAKDVQVL